MLDLFRHRSWVLIVLIVNHENGFVVLSLVMMSILVSNVDNLLVDVFILILVDNIVLLVVSLIEFFIAIHGWLL